MSNRGWKTMDIELLETVRSSNDGHLCSLVNIGNAENYCMSFAAGKNNIFHVAARFGSNYCARFIGDKVSPTTLERLLVQRNYRGNTPLHCAALAHNSYLVDFFVSKMNDVGIKVKNNMGDTALHLAAAGDCLEDLKITRILVGRCQRLGKENNASKEYPVYIAAERGGLEILQCLLRFRDFPTTGPGGKTALHAALVRRDDRMFKYLVKNRRELVVQQDDQGSTPLHYLASCGDQEMTRLLLIAGSSEHLQLRSTHVALISDNNDTSPIHVAAHQGHVEVIRLILQTRPDSCELVDESGGNFLHVAVKQKRKKVVKYVIEENELKHLLSNQQDNNGDTPLHLAVRNHDMEMVKLLLKIEKLSKVLRNSDGMTVLDLMDSELASSRNWNKLTLLGKELLISGAEFSSRRVDHLERKKIFSDEQFCNLQSSSKNVIIVSVLIATVTFTAGFTIPGGYNSDSAGRDAGFAVLSGRIIFKLFMISNAVAMSTSVIATLYLIQAIYHIDRDTVCRTVDVGKSLLLVSFVGMVVSFATGTYVMIPPDSKGFALLVVCLLILVPLIIINTGINTEVILNFENYANQKKSWWNWGSQKIWKRQLKWWGSKFKIRLKYFL